MEENSKLILPKEPEEPKILRVNSMARSATSDGVTIDGARIGPPPDLASLLLNNRIVYVGAPLVPQVTELVLAELLYLSSEGKEDIAMYINSMGSQLTTDAFAITDTMDFVRPKINTICVGSAFGTAAMVLSNGAKGSRKCLPNAKIMLNTPQGQARGQASDIAISAVELLKARQEILELLSKRTGQSVEKILADSSRTKYFTPPEAKEYGIIDDVLNIEDLAVKPATLGR
jgi:ATP-dependent Clp protease protease subunit